MNSAFYFIIPNLSTGGAERVMVTIARLLSARGEQVEFVNLGKPTGEMLGWIKGEFPITSFNLRRTLLAIPKLTRFMKRHSSSLFFGSREHVNLIGLFCAKLTRTKMIVRIPNMPNNKLATGVGGWKMSFVKLFMKRLIPYAKYVIAQNEEMRMQLISFYNLAGDKIIAINNPIDKDSILLSASGSLNPYHENEFNYLTICNIAFSKGVDVLIEAWPMVVDAIPNAHLFIMGRFDTQYGRQLFEQVADRRDITFLGYKSNPYPFLKFCDVFVLPSRMEGFPNVVLEAMCFNRPIVATTCVEVIKELIKPGVNGYYCSVEDYRALSVAMINAKNLSVIKNDYSLFDEKKLLSLFIG